MIFDVNTAINPKDIVKGFVTLGRIPRLSIIGNVVTMRPWDRFDDTSVAIPDEGVTLDDVVEHYLGKPHNNMYSAKNVFGSGIKFFKTHIELNGARFISFSDKRGNTPINLSALDNDSLPEDVKYIESVLEVYRSIGILVDAGIITANETITTKYDLSSRQSIMATLKGLMCSNEYAEAKNQLRYGILSSISKLLCYSTTVHSTEVRIGDILTLNVSEVAEIDSTAPSHLSYSDY